MNANQNGIPVERLRAMIRLLGDGEITPMAKRMLLKLCDEYDRKVPSGA